MWDEEDLMIGDEAFDRERDKALQGQAASATRQPRIEFAEDEPLRLQIVAYGPAASQGSKTPIKNKIGQIVGSRESSKRSRPWRQDVQALMLEVVPEGFQPIDEAVTVRLAIYLSRPNSHFGSGKNSNILKSNAPRFPPTGLDIDKVQRAVGDAMKGIWLKDDARISRWRAMRFYCGPGEPGRTVITCEIRTS